MVARTRISVEARRAFRPDLREAVLEDRILMAAPPSAFLLQPNTNGFNFYFNPPGFTYYFGSGGGGGGPGSGGSGSVNYNLFNGMAAVGPIGATSSITSELGQGFSLNVAMRIQNLFGSSGFTPTTLAGSAFFGPSSLLELPDSFGGDSSATHNNGPIGSSSGASPSAGYGTTFSSGGNFASTFSDTYNGFNNSLQIAPSTSTTAPAPAPGANGGDPSIQERYPEPSAPPAPNPEMMTPGMGPANAMRGMNSIGGGHKVDNLPHPTNP